MKKPKLIQRQIDFLNTLKDGSVALMITEFQTEGKLRYKGYFFVAGEFPIDDVRTKADDRSIRSLIKRGFLEKTSNRVVEKNIPRHQWQITRNKCTCFLRWKEVICPFDDLGNSCTCCPSCQVDCYGRNLPDDAPTRFARNSNFASYIVDDPTPFTEKDFNEITNE